MRLLLAQDRSCSYSWGACGFLLENCRIDPQKACGSGLRLGHGQPRSCSEDRYSDRRDLVIRPWHLGADEVDVGRSLGPFPEQANNAALEGSVVGEGDGGKAFYGDGGEDGGIAGVEDLEAVVAGVFHLDDDVVAPGEAGVEGVADFWGGLLDVGESKVEGADLPGELLDGKAPGGAELAEAGGDGSPRDGGMVRGGGGVPFRSLHVGYYFGKNLEHGWALSWATKKLRISGMKVKRGIC